jgi:hypothetical protein
MKSNLLGCIAALASEGNLPEFSLGRSNQTLRFLQLQQRGVERDDYRDVI